MPPTHTHLYIYLYTYTHTHTYVYILPGAQHLMSVQHYHSETWLYLHLFEVHGVSVQMQSSFHSFAQLISFEYQAKKNRSYKKYIYQQVRIYDTSPILNNTLNPEIYNHFKGGTAV